MVKAVHPYRYTKQMPYVEVGKGKGSISVRPMPRKFFAMFLRDRKGTDPFSTNTFFHGDGLAAFKRRQLEGRRGSIRDRQ